MAKRYVHSFNALLDKQTYEALSTLSEKSGLSKGHIVRTLIRNANAHANSWRFICANGSACLAPSLLVNQQANRKTTVEPTPDQYYHEFGDEAGPALPPNHPVSQG